MVFEEVLEEVTADDLPAAVALAAKSFCNVVKIVLQRFLAVNHAQPAAQTGDNIVPQILFVCDGQDAVRVREEGLVFALVPVPTGVGQPFGVQRVAAKHTANGVGQKALDVPLQVGFADGHILVLHLRGQLVLQAVDIDEDTIQLFLVGFELVEAVIALSFPLSKSICDGSDGADEGVLYKAP